MQHSIKRHAYQDKISSQERGFLTSSQIDFFKEEGFLVIPHFVADETCDRLRQRMDEIVRDFAVSPQPTSRFSTRSEAYLNKYFLDSASNIYFFFEEKAYDDRGYLVYPVEKALNKVSHALHDLDPVFREFSYQKKIKNIFLSLGYKRPVLLQSMYIFKQPHMGGEVVCHQDGTFLHSHPTPPLGLWIALEDATIENGCLYAIPRGHKGPLRSLFQRDGDTLCTEILSKEVFDHSREIALEVKKGALIILDSLLPHRSDENTSSKSRHAYTLHGTDKSAHYPKTNWLQRPEDFPFREM